MRFSVALIFAAAYGIAAALPTEERGIDASACFVTGFEGIDCTGNVGENLGVPPGNSHGTCFGVGSMPVRHSFMISAACPTLNIFSYTKESCSGNTPLESAAGPGCHNIVSSKPINSIRAVRV